MKNQDKLFWVLSFAFIFFIFLKTTIFLKPYSSTLDNYIDQSVSLSGIIIKEPEITNSAQRLTVNLTKQKINVLINTNLDYGFKYGDEINFSGKIKKPRNFITDQYKEFNYIDHLKKDKIFYISNYPKIEIIKHNQGNIIKKFLFQLKNKFLQGINLSVPKPESLLLGGLILGERANFSQEFYQKLIDTGTIHIIALSGFNIMIIINFIFRIFNFLPKNLNIGISIFTILLFIIMTGGSSTAIRAGIMATISLMAIVTGRTYNVARALMITIILMILFNPLILVYDLSFQLSVLATIAIIFLTPKIENFLSKFSSFVKIEKTQSTISTTLSAYIFTLPFLLYKIGIFSAVALIANVLILPFIPITMFFGFIVSLISFLSYLPGSIIFTPFILLLNSVTYYLLHYELSVINYFAEFPFASFTILNFPLWLTILIYIFFAYILFAHYSKKQNECELSANLSSSPKIEDK